MSRKNLQKNSKKHKFSVFFRTNALSNRDFPLYLLNYATEPHFQHDNRVFQMSQNRLEAAVRRLYVTTSSATVFNCAHKKCPAPFKDGAKAGYQACATIVMRRPIWLIIICVDWAAVRYCQGPAEPSMPARGSGRRLYSGRRPCSWRSCSAKGAPKVS